MTEEQNEAQPRKEISAEVFLGICSGGLRDIHIETGYNHFYRADSDNEIYQVVIKGQSIKGEVYLTKSKYTWKFSITDCIFLDAVIFEDAEFLKEVFFENVVFKKGFKFNEPNFHGNLICRRLQVDDNIWLHGGKFSKSFFLDVNCDDGIIPTAAVIIDGGEYNKLVIGSHYSQLRSIDMFTLGVTGNVFIAGRETIIHNIFIRGLSRHLMLSLEDFHVNSISIASYNSSVKFKIHKIKAYNIPNQKAEFKVQNSNLGTAEISTLNLKEFDIVNIRDSYLSNVNFVNTHWPTNITSYEQNGSVIITNTKLEDYYFKSRDTYRQLKYASSKYGDIVTSYEFLAKEMEAYRTQLKYKRINGRKDWWNNKSERINLWLNMFSNYYGNNWLKAVGWTLLFNSILFTFYCWAQGYRIGADWRTFWTLTAYSFEFLNPLRKADFLEHITGRHPAAGAIAIDYTSRIIIAYFVYQTISAFRKFGKRSA